MTPEQLAAILIADVPRYDPHGGTIPDGITLSADQTMIALSEVLAALARAMGPDDLAAEAGKVLEGVTDFYRIDADGSVFSIAHNWRGYGERKITPTVNSHGYLSVRITINGKRKHIPVHRLVAYVHLPPRPSLDHEIRHLDGNKLNPRASNLAWGTKSENARDRLRHGTDKTAANAAKTIHMRKGEKSATAKLTNVEAAAIRNRFLAGETAKAISADYPHVTYWTVNNAARGKTFGG